MKIEKYSDCEKYNWLLYGIKEYWCDCGAEFYIFTTEVNYCPRCGKYTIHQRRGNQNKTEV